jgi:hypothetical protein
MVPQRIFTALVLFSVLGDAFPQKEPQGLWSHFIKRQGLGFTTLLQAVGIQK